MLVCLNTQGWWLMILSPNGKRHPHWTQQECGSIWKRLWYDNEWWLTLIQPNLSVWSFLKWVGVVSLVSILVFSLKPSWTITVKLKKYNSLYIWNTSNQTNQTRQGVTIIVLDRFAAWKWYMVHETTWTYYERCIKKWRYI